MATQTGSKRKLSVNIEALEANNTLTLGGNGVATQSWVNTQISNLVASAPSTMDTLNELAAALGDDPNFATTISTALGNRLRVDTASQGLTSTQKSNARTNLGLGSAATSNTSAFATAAQGTNADTAHGWGNHATRGYLTSFDITTQTDNKYLRSNTDDITTGALTIGDGGNQARLLLKKADNNIANHIEFYNGTTRVGEIGVQDNDWLRLNNYTNKNIYTPRYIRADNGFFVDGTSKGINGSGNFIGGTIAGASDANVSNWDTAYTDRNKWDGGSTGLNASTGRTSLGLGSAATSASTDFVSVNGDTISGNIDLVHAAADTGLVIRVSGGAQPTSTAQFKVGRDTSQYWGVRTDDSTAYLIHRQDETGSSTHQTRFELHSSATGTASWQWWKHDNAGNNAAEKMRLTDDSELTLGGGSNTITNTKVGNWDTAYNNYITGISITGTTTKTITLTQRDGGTISDTFSDLSGAGGDGNDFLINGSWDEGSETLSLEVQNQAPINIALSGTMRDSDTQYTAGTGLTLTGTEFSVTAGTYAAASHNHSSLNLTGSIYNGSANYSIDLKDHSSRTWFRNQVGGWTFQTGTSGDDWTQSFTFYLPAAGTTANAVWAEFGQRDSNDSAAGRYRGLRIVKDTGSVADGDLRAGAIYIGSTQKNLNWDTAYTHSQSAHAPSNAEANVQSDWNATSGDAFIKNKPSTFPPIIGTTSTTAMAGDTPIPSATDILNLLSTNNIVDWTVSQTSNIHADNYTNTTYTVGDNGLTQKNFTTTLKNKLDGIAANANNYVHPTTAGNKHIPSGGSAGQFLKYSSSGTAVWATPSYTTNTDTQYSAGSGLDLTGTTFSIEPDLRDGITRVGKDTSNYIAIDADNNNSIDFYISGVWVARMEADGDLHMKGDVVAFSDIFNP